VEELWQVCVASDATLLLEKEATARDELLARISDSKAGGRRRRGLGTTSVGPSFPDSHSAAGAASASSHADAVEGIPREKKERSPKVRAFVAFLDAEGLTEMVQAMAELRSACDIAESIRGIKLYDAVKAALVDEVNYTEKHAFLVLDAKLRERNCAGLKVAIVGGGPCGLRTAVELSLLGAEVTVLEKRTDFSRLNILHLWPWVCNDLLSFGANGADILGKSFFHVGTGRLQELLAQTALLLGVTVLTAAAFESASESDTSWEVQYSTTAPASLTGAGSPLPMPPQASSVSQTLTTNVLIGAGGATGPVRKFASIDNLVMHTGDAMGMVCHFENTGTAAERELNEFSWASQFNTELFGRLEDAGLPMENCVYYQGDTHYFVLTPKREGLLQWGVLRSEAANMQDLLAPANVDREKMATFARAVASFFGLPDSVPAVPGSLGAMLFDFRCVYDSNYPT
jgi:hypothetical protein